MKRPPLLRRLWKRIRSWRSVRHQITWSGAAFSGLILMVGLGAFASANNLLFLLLAALIATLLVSGFVSRLSLSGLEVRLLLPEHVFARRKTPARVQLTNNKRWMTSYSIHLWSTDKEESPTRLYFPIVGGGATLESLATVQFRRRGVHGDSEYQFMTRFPFGFTERRMQVQLRREVLVYPSVDPRPGFEELLRACEGDLEAYQRGRGSDFYRIRPYEPRESSRHVDWKATAHTGELQVREFARDEDHLVEIYLDLAIPMGQEQWLEQAIDCCAFLAWRIASKNSRMRFVSQLCDIRVPESASIYTILEFLARAEVSRVRPLVQPHEESSFQIVFSLTPEKLVEAGWTSARLLNADAFSGLEPDNPVPQPAAKK